jgi:hypothetical protein
MVFRWFVNTSNVRAKVRDGRAIAVGMNIHEVVASYDLRVFLQTQTRLPVSPRDPARTLITGSLTLRLVAKSLDNVQ